MKRLGIWQDGSPEWLAARLGRIGGSEIGVVCGWSPWETRDQLLGRKLGTTPPRVQTDAMGRGHYLEPAVAAWLADKSGLTYDEDASKGTYVHPEHDFALYNPDRITTAGDLVEIKTAGTRDGWGRAGTDAIPLTYQAQCVWGMHVLGMKVCHVGVLFGSPFQFKRYKVRYDPEVADYLVTEGERFISELIHDRSNAA